MFSIPDFFQDDCEEALRSQVEWQTAHLGLDDSFFANLLREEPRVVSCWRKDRNSFSESKKDVLRDWWQAVLHLLSFQNFDEEKVCGSSSNRPRRNAVPSRPFSLLLGPHRR